jgi:ABC-type branched-subunit amino acid transport system permease subunit
VSAVLSRYRSVLPAVPPWAYAAFLAVALGWVVVAPTYWVFLGSAACLTAIAALGLTVVVGWAGEVSLAQASAMGTAVYVTGYVSRPEDGYGLPFLVALGAGVAVSTALYALVSLPTARMSGIYVMVLTLGLQVTIERTLFANAKLTGGAQGFYQTRPEIFGVSFEPERAFYYLTLAILGAVILFLTLLRQSRHGRALFLVKTNREAAAAVGISPWRYKILAFAVCGVLAGLAGALTAPLYRSPPTSFQYLSIPSLFLLAIPVTAGFESLLGVVIVAFTFTMIPQTLQSLHVSTFVVAGAGLLAGTYLGPRGVGGVLLDRLRDRREVALLAAPGLGPQRPPAGLPTVTAEAVVSANSATVDLTRPPAGAAIGAGGADTHEEGRS